MTSEYAERQRWLAQCARVWMHTQHTPPPPASAPYLDRLMYHVFACTANTDLYYALQKYLEEMDARI